MRLKLATADAGYAYAKVYGCLERRGIDAVRFRYDAHHYVVKCPRGVSYGLVNRSPVARFFLLPGRNFAGCDLASLCLSKGRVNKAVVISDDYPALLRARRRRERWSAEDQPGATVWQGFERRVESLPAAVAAGHKPGEVGVAPSESNINNTRSDAASPPDASRFSIPREISTSTRMSWATQLRRVLAAICDQRHLCRQDDDRRRAIMWGSESMSQGRFRVLAIMACVLTPSSGWSEISAEKAEILAANRARTCYVDMADAQIKCGGRARRTLSEARTLLTPGTLVKIGEPNNCDAQHSIWLFKWRAFPTHPNLAVNVETGKVIECKS